MFHLMSLKKKEMNITTGVRRFVNGRWHAAAAGLTLMSLVSAMGRDIQVPLLKTRTGNYTNVTVTGASRTDIYIFHSQGITNIKLADLEPETIGLLGLA